MTHTLISDNKACNVIRLYTLQAALRTLAKRTELAPNSNAYLCVILRANMDLFEMKDEHRPYIEGLINYIQQELDAPGSRPFNRPENRSLGVWLVHQGMLEWASDRHGTHISNLARQAWVERMIEYLEGALKPNTHQVIVGNVGTVYDGNSPLSAAYAYLEHVALSNSAHSRAAGEPVTWFMDGDVHREYTPATEKE